MEDTQAVRSVLVLQKSKMMLVRMCVLCLLRLFRWFTLLCYRQDWCGLWVVVVFRIYCEMCALSIIRLLRLPLQLPNMLEIHLHIVTSRAPLSRMQTPNVRFRGAPTRRPFWRESGETSTKSESRSTTRLAHSIHLHLHIFKMQLYETVADAFAAHIAGDIAELLQSDRSLPHNDRTVDAGICA